MNNDFDKIKNIFFFTYESVCFILGKVYKKTG